MEKGLESVTGGAATSHDSQGRTQDEREALKREILEELRREIEQARKPWRLQLRGRSTR